MSKLHEARLKLRGELEAPPALRQLGSGWISGVLGLVLGFTADLNWRFGWPPEKWPGLRHPVPRGYLTQFKYPIQRKKAAE